MYEILVGAGITIVAQLAKKSGIDQKYIVTVLAILGAGGYYIYNTYTNTASQEQIIITLTSISGSATLIYNAIQIAIQQTKPKKEKEEFVDEMHI